MKEFLLDYLQSNTGALTLEDILLNFVVAGILGVVIFISYRISHSGTTYSARFNVSLVMLALTTTLVMNVIGNNIALSLGMVGALSIVRFRTAIKDPRDTTYIFWCIAIGICCGVSEYLIAGIGSIVIFLFMLLFGAIKKNERYLLIIRGSDDAKDELEKAIEQLYGNRISLRVDSVTNGALEQIYELTQKQVNASKKRNGPASKILTAVDGVEYASLVCQNDEINR